MPFYVRSCERSLRPANLAFPGRGSHRQLSDARFGEVAWRGPPRPASEKRFWFGFGAAFAHPNVLLPAREPRTGQHRLLRSSALAVRPPARFRLRLRARFFAEVSEQLLPAAEPNEKYFRLLTAMLEHLRAGGPGAVWRAVTYFSLWAVRLAGFLPELACLPRLRRLAGRSGKSAARVFHPPSRRPVLPGLPPRAGHARRMGTRAGIARLAEEILRTPVGQLRDRPVDAGHRRRPAPFPRSANGIPHRAKAHHRSRSRSRRLTRHVSIERSDIPGNRLPAEALLERARLHHSGAVRRRSRRRNIHVPETFLRALGPKP